MGEESPLDKVPILLSNGTAPQQQVLFFGEPVESRSTLVVVCDTMTSNCKWLIMCTHSLLGALVLCFRKILPSLKRHDRVEVFQLQDFPNGRSTLGIGSPHLLSLILKNVKITS
ncbi:hypothetical protein NPIL_36791 [Nephila pilipes]|uniref:Uncharacterized protein n=1 Tax=Nephila pilipes TaxID=299642 RepID=A0A8X6TPS3_NEPPI|nr:hypothetical protein NPIL_36791 [Nephila pilipes]